MSAEMMADLKRAMEEGYRVLITGGTRTGKTTLLSALCNFLPLGWRIIKMEDPSEIWIDRDTVQTIEARPAALGTDLVPYTLADAVDDAMRMSPDYLITGEVRDGRAGMALFRAMMTGHSGACTFHADSPREAVQRLVTILGADGNVPAPEARQMIADSVDLLVQISIPRQIDKRVAMSIQNVCRELRDGEVVFNPIWKIKPDYRSWERVGQLGDRDPDAVKEKNSMIVVAGLLAGVLVLVIMLPPISLRRGRGKAAEALSEAWSLETTKKMAEKKSEKPTLEYQLLAAGVNLDVRTFQLLQIGIGLIAAVVFWIFIPGIPAIVLGAIAWYIPRHAWSATGPRAAGGRSTSTCRSR